MARSQKYSISNSSSKEYQQNTDTSETVQLKDVEYNFASDASKMPVLTVIDPIKPKTNYRPWIAMIVVGICAAIFLGFMYGDPNSPIHLRGPKASYTANVIVQGSLVSYPHLPGFNSHDRFPNEYFVGLDDKYREFNIDSLVNVTSGYPQNISNQSPPDPYVHCWLETPKPQNPCFFDKAWLGYHCLRSNRFGYAKGADDFDSPCFLLRLENTGSWRPRNLKVNEIGGDHAKHYDPSFIDLDCKPANSRWKHVSLIQYPAKGFPLAFFPMDAFNSSEYMLPAIMVKVSGIRKDENVTIECLLRSPDSFHLTDLGRIKVTFFHNAKLIESVDIDPRYHLKRVGIEENVTSEPTTTTEMFQYETNYDRSLSATLMRIEESTPIQTTTDDSDLIFVN